MLKDNYPNCLEFNTLMSYFFISHSQATSFNAVVYAESYLLPLRQSRLASL